jgi:hypothetical protein
VRVEELLDRYLEADGEHDLHGGRKQVSIGLLSVLELPRELSRLGSADDLVDGDDGERLADAAAQRQVDLVLPCGEGVGGAG